MGFGTCVEGLGGSDALVSGESRKAWSFPGVEGFGADARKGWDVRQRVQKLLLLRWSPTKEVDMCQRSAG